MLLHLPVLSRPDFFLFRAPGPGLGNLMFPIARALIGQARWGGVFVPPTLRQIKFGTYVRREADKRTYGQLLKHRTSEDWMNRFRVIRTTKVDETRFGGQRYGSSTVVYEGLGNFFHDIADNHEIIGGWIFKNSRVILDDLEKIDIAVHVRRGDFTHANGAGASIRIPDEWYVEAVREAGKLLGTAKPRCVIFSDGPASQVEGLSRQLNAVIDDSPNALASLMAMSRGKVIVTSRSTFSMWAALLGRQIAIWDKHFESSKYWPNRPCLDVLF
ncbi:alpha-1,2-fucosyltransferase [Mesorhizobium sp.]|uniref:alpha-1,2-fucosyltransferase n=1 Tax=Mesorhizobium sp. TaxID=1871066 RepID=UPI002585DECC|nr:alpha-1,2-fucosyltransferase [Mesorhizobium sp.]